MANIFSDELFVLKDFLFESQCSICEKGQFQSLTIDFKAKNNKKIYHVSEQNEKGNLKSAKNFNFARLVFDSKNYIYFVGALIESLSGYLYGVRKAVSGNENPFSYIIDLKEDSFGRNNYKLRITPNKEYKRIKSDKRRNEKDATKTRVFISVFDNNENEELVEIRLSRRDVILVLASIKTSYQSLNIEKAAFMAVPAAKSVDSRADGFSQGTISMVSVDKNTIGFSDVFLHGQEILNLQQLVLRLIFEPEVQNELLSCCFQYRQIECFLNEYILTLKLRKMQIDERLSLDGKQTVYMHKKEEGGTELDLFVNNIVLAGLYLNLKTSLVARASLEEVEEIVATKKRKNKDALLKITTKEAVLGIGMGKNFTKKDNDNTHTFFVLKGEAKNTKDVFGDKIYAMSDNDNGAISYFPKDGSEKKNVPILEKFSIPLYNQWTVLLSMLSIAYSRKFLITGNEHDFFLKNVNNREIEIYGADHIGSCRYVLKMLSDESNKFPFVLIVEKYRSKRLISEKKYKNTIESKFRMPLTRKHLFQLISICIEFSVFSKDYKYSTETTKFSILPISFNDKEHIKEDNETKIKYGIEKKGNEVWLGLLDGKFQKVMLQKSDKISLVESCKNRILYGKWLPFTGLKCSLTTGGYITTENGEFKLEEETFGSLYAWEFLYGGNFV